MSAQWSDFTYASQFNGNLHKQSEPVPVQVTIRLRVMSPEAARQVQCGLPRLSDPPKYTSASGQGTPYEAVGRHYFTWNF